MAITVEILLKQIDSLLDKYEQAVKKYFDRKTEIIRKYEYNKNLTNMNMCDIMKLTHTDEIFLLCKLERSFNYVEREFQQKLDKAYNNYFKFLEIIEI
jgi:hypothetical protein